MKRGYDYIPQSSQYAEQLKKVMAQKEIDHAIESAATSPVYPHQNPEGGLEKKIGISPHDIFVREGTAGFMGSWLRGDSPEGISLINSLGGIPVPGNEADKRIIKR